MPFAANCHKPYEAASGSKIQIHIVIVEKKHSALKHKQN